MGAGAERGESTGAEPSPQSGGGRHRRDAPALARSGRRAARASGIKGNITKLRRYVRLGRDVYQIILQPHLQRMAHRVDTPVQTVEDLLPVSAVGDDIVHP